MRRICEATPIALAGESEETGTDARRTETCVALRHADASRVFLCHFIFSELAAWGRWGAARLFNFFFFPCLADHQRDWSLFKVVIFFKQLKD